ncbi:MAG: FAD-dependent oxidoreductase [Deltaproteobacteria bacterium]|nr:FAD-dependent oxidoreductase [Deltaproteobacteria bacterium]
MSDELVPLSLDRLAAWIAAELEQRDALFGVPRRLFFTPVGGEPWAPTVFGERLATPVGVAAGPHTQLAQNIVLAWLTGARVIELKTVQVLDELEIARPCIDMQDEGYNVEWSQELRLPASYREYLNAWVLIHALHKRLGFPGDGPGVLFNASVGYEMKGLLSPTVQAFLARIKDIGPDLQDAIDAVRPHLPEVCDIAIPTAMCTTVTLSTMHGTPPSEIEALALHLMEAQGLHTAVKLNPTLMGPDFVRGTLHRLGFTDVTVPDAAFGHDPTWDAAEPMLRRLEARGLELGLVFGVKLTNTLEVLNHRGVFPPNEAQMYLSGRPLHAIAAAVAARISGAFGGRLPMSFAGGADAFRIAPLLAGGLQTVTVCSDLLKSGGYGRMSQYLEELDRVWGDARDAEALAVKTDALRADFPEVVVRLFGAEGEELARRVQATDRDLSETVGQWCVEHGRDARATRDALVAQCRVRNLSAYAASLQTDPQLHKDFVDTAETKSARPLGFLDCIAAPCTEACAVDQDVPSYMRAVRQGDWAAAVEVVRSENPLGATLSHICDRRCQDACVRTLIDQPLMIREIKRAILSHEGQRTVRRPAAPTGQRVAIVGAGPLGLCAARELQQAGYACTVFDRADRPGGTVAATIPSWRLPHRIIHQDWRVLEQLGVALRFGQALGGDLTLEGLRADYDAVILATGAQVGKRLGLDGEDAEGVFDAFGFLARVRAGLAARLGEKVAVIGAGDVAMDAARTAWRLGHEVVVLYRRTLDEAPADPEELEGLLEEGIPVRTLVAPVALLTRGGVLRGLRVQRMELGPKGADGRRRPEPVEGAYEELAVDSLLVAVSQRSDLAWADGLELNRWGAIVTDATTGETSMDGVYAGGDVADDGPASAVRACGDGKRLAASVRARSEGAQVQGVEPLPRADYAALELRRARRQFAPSPLHLPADGRRHFGEVAQTLPDALAQAEAARCIECDSYCSACVSVCPNRSLFTYFVTPGQLKLPSIEVGKSGVVVGVGATLSVTQGPQVALMADWCNQCGNCTTFCPTAGRPWHDKPRLYLDPAEYAGDEDNAWLLRRVDGTLSLRGKVRGVEHLLERRGPRLRYRSQGVEVEFEGTAFSGARVTDAPVGTVISLDTAGFMLVFLDGLEASAGHLIAAAR